MTPVSRKNMFCKKFNLIKTVLQWQNSQFKKTCFSDYNCYIKIKKNVGKTTFLTQSTDSYFFDFLKKSF